MFAHLFTRISYFFALHCSKRRKRNTQFWINRLECRQLFAADVFTGIFDSGQWRLDNLAPEVVEFGLPGDQPVMGDWNGDGKETPGIYRNGTWVLDSSGDGFDSGDRVLLFGLPGDRAVAGDWDGDGKDTVGVFRDGWWFYDNDGNGYDAADQFPIAFGWANDQPVVGDWNGDRKDTPGIYRDGTWAMDLTGNGYDSGDRFVQFGLPGDQPIAGDWNGDGKDKPGVLQNGSWFFDREGNGYSGEAGIPNQLGTGIAVSGSRPHLTTPQNEADTGTSQTNSGTGNDHDKIYRVTNKPLAGRHINLENRRLTFNHNGGADKLASVLVRVTNPDRNSGTYSVRLYWTSGSGLDAKYLLPAGERIVAVDRYKGDQRVDFGKLDMTSRPDPASHLIAVVNGDHKVKESNSRDNVRGVELLSRTFVIRISGFLSSSSSGLDGLKLDSLKKNSNSHLVMTTTIKPQWTAPGGTRMLEDTRASIGRSLARLNATARDKIVLIGHSYGGDIALRLSSDVNPNLAGNQPASSLVLIDPIDFVLAQKKGKTDQFNEVRNLPAGFNSQNVLVISSNLKPELVRGYRIAGFGLKSDIQRLWHGADGRPDTKDDLHHTSVDDSPLVWRKIESFVTQQFNRR